MLEALGLFVFASGLIGLGVWWIRTSDGEGVVALDLTTKLWVAILGKRGAEMVWGVIFLVAGISILLCGVGALVESVAALF